MFRIAIVILALPLLVLGCELNEPPAKSAAKTVKVTKGLCKVEVALKGVLAAGEMTEVRISPKAWTGPFTIRKVAEHGSRVKKGDVLVELDPEKLDLALRDLETEIRLSELSISLAEAELPVLEKLMPLELAEADRLKKHAVEDLERYLKIDRAYSEESAKQYAQLAEHWLEYAREELKQLQKMYRDKELTEETEEIILKRQRHMVERAEFMVKTAKLSLAETLEVTLPRKDVSAREAVRKLTLAHDKAQGTLPLNLAQKKLNLAKQRQELEKSREREGRLKHDRTLMTVTAPADGIVYYGRAVHGQFPALPNNPIEQKLVIGGNLSPEEVFVTVVSPSPTQIYATVEEKDLHLLQEGQAGRVTPTGYPDLKLPARVKTRDLVRLPNGNFLAVVTLNEAPPASLRPGMNCTIKVPVYEKANALLVPTTAVQHEEADEEQTYVNLASANGKQVKRPVKVGKAMGSKTEVLEGLKEGDEILAGKPEEK